MTLRFIRGDLFRSTDEAIVNTVNCVGVMGKGIALEFKQRFPEMFADYATACNAGEVRIGKCHIWLPPGKHKSIIVNFPTKEHWRNPSKLEWIVAGLEDLASVIADFHIRSISIPALGCSNGGLDWRDVRKKIENWYVDLEDPGLRVNVFVPQ